MKKKILLAVSIALLLCLMAVGVGAKIVNVSNNQSFATAAKVDFGDKIVIETVFGFSGKGARIYRFTVPYNGVLTIDETLECMEGEKHQYSTIYTYIYDINENLLGDFTLTEKKSYQHEEYKLMLSPGDYYYYFWSTPFSTNDCTRINAELSFECSHLDTEVNIIREASCSRKGYIEEICSECGEIADEYETDKLDHESDSEWTITREASCAEAGEQVRYCTLCGEEAEVEEIKKLPHVYSEWETAKEPTCHEEGIENRVCSECGFIDEKEIDRLEHEWCDWIVLSEATCEYEGLRSQTCSTCETEKKETIEKIDHKFGSWKTTIKATEDRTGEKTRTCKECDFEDKESIPQLRHGEEFTWEYSISATCTSDGMRTKICDYCGRVITTEKTYAKGHKWGEWIITKEPTQAKKGEKKRECEICGVYEKVDVTLTHGNFGEWKVTKEATCDQNGEKKFYCNCCFMPIETKIIKSTGHSYGEAEVTTTPSPDKDGESTAKCKNCDEAKKEKVKYDFDKLKKTPVGAHPFGDVKLTSWYNDVVKNCYHYGLMLGNSATTFNPSGNITRAEVITSAVRIYCLNNPNATKPNTTGSPWYKGYVDFAIAKKIIKADDFSDYTVPATRAEMAYIFANAVGEKNLEKINNVTSIPDVNSGDKYANEIFSLYNAGVLTGSDNKGTFNPNQNIVRSESAAIIARISKISDRVKK